MVSIRSPTAITSPWTQWSATSQLSSTLWAMTPVIITGGFGHGPIAMRYAAEFPDRVSHLILNSTSARGADLFECVPPFQALYATLHADWESFVSMQSRLILDLDHPLSDEVEAVIRQEMSHDQMMRQWDALRSYDATPWLGSISAPTLLMQRTGVRMQILTHDLMRQLAKEIPHSALVRSESTADSTRQIQEFIGTQNPQLPMERSVPSGSPSWSRPHRLHR